jgi:hypothetical protein
MHRWRGRDERNGCVKALVERRQEMVVIKRREIIQRRRTT